MILGVNYDHQVMPTAYVRVGGPDELSAEQNAKKVCVIIKERLPDAIVAPSPGPAGWSDAVLDLLRADREERHATSG